MTTNRSEGIQRAIQVLEDAGEIGKGLFFHAETGRACSAGTLAHAAGLDPAQHNHRPTAQVVFDTIRDAYGLTNGEIATMMTYSDHGHQGQHLPAETGRKNEAIDYLRGLLADA